MAVGIPQDLKDAFTRLLVLDVQRHLPGTPGDPPRLIMPEEMAALLGVASHLSMSEDYFDKDSAFEIATRVAMLGGPEYPGLARGSELVLARLGNFPGRKLLRDRFPQLPKGLPLLQLEMRMHEIENTYTDPGGRKIKLTDFQHESLAVFSAHTSVSLSAPTSAGKSFLLTLEVVRKLQQRKPAFIVYVVPTRALIRQVVVDLRKQVNESGIPAPFIRSVPRLVTPEAAPNGVVYVLTQERLLSLIDGEDGEPWITSLIVDEAQEIGSGARGVLLHTAIERVRYRFPKAEIIFAAPLAKNPEYLLELFDCQNGHPHHERHSPVSRNLVLVESTELNSRTVSCTMLFAGDRIELGNRTLDFAFSTLSGVKRLAFFARNLVRNSDPENCCIVYANGAAIAENIALHLIGDMEANQVIDQEVLDLIQYIKDHVHPQYGLAEVLRFGVAFHFSNMPGAVRAGVEDLFQRRKLKFLCCTSTLLQGVNLPARHIVMETPLRGKDYPMDRANFLNLAGRAGRLNHEFHGNVWCLLPHKWEESCYQGDPQQEIRSSFDRVLADGGSAIRRVFDEDESATSTTEDAVAALGRAFTEFIQTGRSLIDRYRTPGNAPSLFETQNLLLNLHRTVTLPPDIFSKNPGVHPRRLELLFEHFKNQSDLTLFFPIHPKLVGTNIRLREIFKTVELFFRGVDDGSYRYHSRIAWAWVHEESLAAIIRQGIKYQNDVAKLQNPPKKVSVRAVINELISMIEGIIRYRYVKYARAYNAVLAQALRERGQQEAADELVPIYLNLEAGAFNQVPISLMSLGLSRVTALFLAQRVFLPTDATPERCLELCKETLRNSPGLRLSPTMRREIDGVLG